MLFPIAIKVSPGENMDFFRMKAAKIEVKDHNQCIPTTNRHLVPRIGLDLAKAKKPNTWTSGSPHLLFYPRDPHSFTVFANLGTAFLCTPPPTTTGVVIMNPMEVTE